MHDAKQIEAGDSGRQQRLNESNTAIDAFHRENLRERISGVEQEKEKENQIEERWKGRSDGGHCKDQKERDAGVDERMNEC